MGMALTVDEGTKSLMLYRHVHDVAVRAQELVADLNGCLETERRFLPRKHDAHDVVGIAAFIGSRSIAGLGLLGVDRLYRVGKRVAEAPCCGWRAGRPGRPLQRRVLTEYRAAQLQQCCRVYRGHRFTWPVV